MMLALIAVLGSTAALAQSVPQPTAPAKPHTAPGKPQSVAARLQSCLDVDDGTKDRLNCYDAG